MIHIISLLAAIFGLVGVSTQFANAQQDKVVVITTPQPAVGDTWAYKTRKGGQYTKTVQEVTPDGGYVIVHSDFPDARFRFDANLSVRDVEGRFPLDKRITVGWRYIDFPMSVGKKFSYRVEGSQGWFTIDSVAAPKLVTVTVPAGTFEALEIESCWKNESSGWSGCGMKYWYAPTAKEFVKRETPSTWAEALRRNDFELSSISKSKQ